MELNEELAELVGVFIGFSPGKLEESLELNMATAVISNSHFERFDKLTWYDDCTGGIQYNLMRAGYFPHISPVFSEKQISQSDILIVIAPVKPWSDEEIDSRYRDRDYAAGHRLVMLKSEVVRFLKRVNMDLIVRVVIHRYVERRYGNDEAKYKEEAGVFILRNSGKLESVGIRAETRGETDR